MRTIDRHERRQEAAELYRQGLTIYEIADRVGVTSPTVWRDLVEAGVIPHMRHRYPAARKPRRRPPVITPERAALAFTADRGWHMVQAPPGWLLDALAEME